MTDRMVVGIGEIARGAGRIIAESRGWPVMEADSFKDVRARIYQHSSQTTLVIADRKALAAGTMLDFSDELARSNMCHPVSFLVGESAQSLEELARRIPPRPSVEAASAPRFAIVHSDYRTLVRGLSLSPLAPDLASDPRAVLAEESSLLFLIGHSSGFDAGFDEFAICRRPSGVAPPADFRAFPCFYGAECRFNEPVLQALPPTIIGARKLVNITCWGFGLQDNMFAAELTVGSGLMEASKAESMITSIRAFPLERSDVLALYYSIISGHSFATATALVNKLRVQRGLRADFFCFGDPDGAVERSVQPIQCEWDDDTGSVAALAETSARDMVIPLPDNCDPSRTAILLGAGSEGVTCGLSLAGSLFISRSTEPPGDGLNLHLLPLEDKSLGILRSPQDLTSNFNHLEHLARSLRYLCGEGPGSAEASQLVSAIDALRRLLLAWPFLSLKSGDVVRSVDIAEAFDRLSFQLDGIGAAFARLYRALINRGSPYWLLLGKDLGTVETEVPSAVSCSYCGQPVDEVTTFALGSTSRTYGCCYVCGPIYDVVEGGEKWMSAALAAPNEPHTYTFRARNLLRFPVSAIAGMAVAPFGSESPIFTIEKATIKPGENVSLSVKADLPPGFTPGTRYAMGFVVVGTSVNLFRRPVVITAAGGRASTQAASPGRP